jgi:S-sulfo-L-cysteine synthase (O-acetyl-L-serine-dependent)
MHSLFALIGNTPLIEFKALAAQHGISERVRIFGKAEWMNPGGSVKDRPALNIIETAEASGALTKEKILLDATSGNTGIAFAMIGAAKGYRVTLCMPESASIERRKIIAAYGAEIIFTPAAESSDGSIRKAQALYAANPDRYFYADQYSNDANWQAHYHTTGKEIWSQTSGRITHFVAAMGTTGTFIGTSRRLKECNPSVVCAAVQPDLAVHGLEGVKHLESALVPKIYDATVPDRLIEVSTETAWDYANQIPKTEGVLLGVSAAANVYAALRVAKEISDGGGSGTVVTILCDNGMKYLSEHFWKSV